jgi:hypothetical protein
MGSSSLCVKDTPRGAEDSCYLGNTFFERNDAASIALAFLLFSVRLNFADGAGL